MTAAQYLDDETVLNHLSWLTPEEVEAVLKKKAEEEFGRMYGENGDGGADDEDAEEEEIPE